MYVVPIYRQKINESAIADTYQCWILLERNGTLCISVDSVEQAAAFAEDNALALRRAPIHSGPYIFLDVDGEKTSLADFYTWSDILVGEQPLREVWRPFLWMVSKRSEEEDIWGTNTYLNFLVCAPPAGTILMLLREYFRCHSDTTRPSAPSRSSQ